MPWSAGSFSRTNGVNTGANLWAADRDAGTKIRADRHDTHDQDLADGINATLAKDGTNAATANLDFGGFRVTNLGDGTARDDAASVGQTQDGDNSFAIDSGAANAYVIGLSPAISAYVNGMRAWFEVGTGNTNTAASTINIDSVGAKSIKLIDNSDTAPGALVAGRVYGLIYESTADVFYLLNPSVFGDLTMRDTAAGASVGPKLTLHRDNTPATSNFIGAIDFDGEDDADNQETYGRIAVQIRDETSTTEDGRLHFQTVQAGTLANRVLIENGIYGNGATGGDQGADTANFSGIYDDGAQIFPVTEDGATATTSGATVSITGLTSARRIVIVFHGVSGNGTDTLELALGDSGGIETTGYAGGGERSATGFAHPTDAFRLIEDTAAAATWTGTIDLYRVNSSNNTWIMRSTLSREDTNSGVSQATGSKSLSAALDRFQLQWSGTDNFDAGEINVFWQQ